MFTKEDTSKIPTLQKRKFKQWLAHITVSKENIKKRLMQLKISRAQGPDQLHPRLLKELSEEISLLLEIILIQSLKQGCLPKIWKVREISAIFKKGNRRAAGNYRPVSLTSILCKTLESIVREKIIQHMRDNNLFSKLQYGFIDRRSTTLQLLYILDEWTEILDDGGTVDVVYMDFMKAFDKVPHERLLAKLSAYGIGGDVLTWIRSFLLNRKQSRGGHIRMERGNQRYTPSISPGPILFVMYINDMPESLENNSTVKMFADDSKLYKRTDNTNGSSVMAYPVDMLWHIWNGDRGCTPKGR